MRRFLGVSISDPDRWRLVDIDTGKVYQPNPELVTKPDLSFDERWLEISDTPVLDLTEESVSG